MKLWQTKTIKFWPDEWYWLYDNSKVERYVSNEVWDISEYELWMYLCKSWYECGVVSSISDKELVVDFNHELAWKDLIFDITIKSIN